MQQDPRVLIYCYRLAGSTFNAIDLVHERLNQLSGDDTAVSGANILFDALMVEWGIGNGDVRVLRKCHNFFQCPTHDVHINDEEREFLLQILPLFFFVDIVDVHNELTARDAIISSLFHCGRRKVDRTWEECCEDKAMIFGKDHVLWIEKPMLTAQALRQMAIEYIDRTVYSQL